MTKQEAESLAHEMCQDFSKIPLAVVKLKGAYTVLLPSEVESRHIQRGDIIVEITYRPDFGMGDESMAPKEAVKILIKDLYIDTYVDDLREYLLEEDPFRGNPMNYGYDHPKIIQFQECMKVLENWISED